MQRSILAVLTGTVLWTTLWLATSVVIKKMMPEWFPLCQPIQNIWVLLLIAGYSAVYGFVSGFVNALLAQKNELQHAMAQAAVIFILGLPVLIKYWRVVPIWFYVLFVVAVTVGLFFGGGLRSEMAE